MIDSTIAVLDIDGTLIDSNYQHALAWYRALRSVGETFPVWRLHRLIGMGGDQVLTAAGGEDLAAAVRRQDQELLLELRAAEEMLTQQLGRTPDDRELARHLSVPKDDVRQARQAHLAFTTHSLDAPLSHNDDPGLLGDILGEDDPDLAHATDLEAVRAHLDELPEREQRILMWRFYGNLTQSQIGARLGLSQMHVSRLLERALAYLRIQITESA